MKRVRFFLSWFGILLGFLIIIWQIRSNVSEVEFPTFSTTNVVHFCLAILLCSLALIIQMLAWYKLNITGGRKVPFAILASIYYLSLVPRYIPGTVWGYVSRAELTNQFIEDQSKATYPFVGVELLLALQAGVIGLFFRISYELVGWEKIVIYFCLFIFCFILYRLHGRILHLMKLVSSKVGMTIDEIKIDLKTWAIISVLLFGNWFLYGAALVIVLQAFGGNIEFTINNWWISSLDFCVSWLLGFIIILVPSGLGVREYALGYLLRRSDIPGSISVAATISLRLIVSVAEVIFILISIAFLAPRMKKLLLIRRNASKN